MSIHIATNGIISFLFMTEQYSIVYICVCVCVCVCVCARAHVHCCSVAKFCLILCDPMDCNPPRSSVPGISRQECWSGLLPFPPPGDVSYPEIEPSSPTLAGRFFTTEPTGKLWTLECMYLLQLEFSSFSDICPGVGFLNHMITLFLVF